MMSFSAVRKHFPKLLKLDGHELPPPITFDLELSTELLPPQKDNYFKNDAVQDLVVKFVNEYYDAFDSGNRKQLVAAYHDEAAFSMTSGYNRMVVGKQPPWPKCATQNRNLLRVNNSERRMNMLKRGKQNIISYLDYRFLNTKHDRNSLRVDVGIVTNELLMFSVSGIFKEAGSGKSRRGIIRTFQRFFSTISQGGGIVITNDMMTLTNASPRQIQGAFKTPAPTPSSRPVPGVAPQDNPLQATDPAKLVMPQTLCADTGMNGEWLTKCLEQNAGDLMFINLHGPNTPAPMPSSKPVLVAAPQHNPLLAATRAMLLRFCVQSGMNVEWSTKCLEQNDWNFDKAAKVFTDFHKEGKIPPEAFKQ